MAKQGMILEKLANELEKRKKAVAIYLQIEDLLSCVQRQIFYLY